MKEKDEFSWPLMFMVTGASFLLFSGFTRLLDGSSSHVGFFFAIGIAALAFAVLSFLVELIAQSGETDSPKYSPAGKE